jgi:hypothetical protein
VVRPAAAEETVEHQHDRSSSSSIDVEELTIANLLASGFSIMVNCKFVDKIVIILMCVKYTHCVSGRYSRI